MGLPTTSDVLALRAPFLARRRPGRPGTPEPEELGSPRSAALYLGLLGGLAILAASGPTPAFGIPIVVPLAAACSMAVLLAASAQLRACRPTWAASRHDPFLAFAGAIAALLGPWMVQVVQHVPGGVGSGATWLSGSTAGALMAVGVLVLIRDMVPGHTLDTLYLSVIGATALGLVGWVMLPHLLGTGPLTMEQDLGWLLTALVDLTVLGLCLHAVRLRTSANQGCWLLLAGWSAVLAVHVAGVAASMTGVPADPRGLAAAWIIALGCVGAAALHPSTTNAGEPKVGSFDRLPRSQIVVLGASVVAGPIILATRLHAPRSLSFVLACSAVLSLLVLTYLVRLVQGRAVFEHRAHHDELTGLANRTLFEERAAAGIARSQRTGGHSAVLFLDLDRFKTVNDSLGHAAGNLLLKAVALRLRSAVGPEDTVARLGGDEFVVFLPELVSPRDAADRADQILHRFEDPFSLNGQRVFASPSIGVAVSPADGEDPDLLLENADAAMYRAKQRGRRTYCTYDRSMNHHAQERMELESRLHTAIERGELRLHYQPKFHLASGRMTGMEALLRWEHPELGLLEPAQFIPIAEESGLIVPVGEWALQEACRQNRAWTEAGYDPLVVAVNLSLRQFQQQHISDLTARVLRSTGLDPTLLELEVTESLAMEDPDVVQSTLHELREMGVACSIDDFGTGYSGLSHLTRFPIDKLKIDKSFVATIDADREAPIVVAVVALAHGLGLEVVAEGVETKTQLTRLRELGCDEMQGYLFSRPVPAERFEELLGADAAFRRLPRDERHRRTADMALG